MQNSKTWMKQCCNGMRLQVDFHTAGMSLMQVDEKLKDDVAKNKWYKNDIKLYIKHDVNGQNASNIPEWQVERGSEDHWPAALLSTEKLSYYTLANLTKQTQVLSPSSSPCSGLCPPAGRSGTWDWMKTLPLSLTDHYVSAVSISAHRADSILRYITIPRRGPRQRGRAWCLHIIRGLLLTN